MKIDDRVEPLVRAVLDAAVHRKESRFEQTVAELSRRGLLQEGGELVVAISAFVLFEIHDGLPTAAEIEDLASDIAQQEAWMSPATADVRAYLLALVEQRSLVDVLDEKNIIILPYLVAANLLATSADPNSGEWWFKYLDKVEAAIEAAG